MPGCISPDIHVEIYEQFMKGNKKESRDLYNKLLPLLNISMSLGIIVYKEVLKRRGIFQSNRMRISSPKLDKYDIIELDAILEELEPHYKVI
jgi:4-hydroxy-tetrahydrodipicolinate synthase